ncbi:MAG TPA: HAD family hydrolase [Bacteroidota bacterium]|jgi:HAD superfamily hydrolase (TIGR01509 family)|nr:HAD family hydrolase [Bacteroidota bacterium]
MKRISCIIFDLDGTLAQTSELIYASFNHIAEKYVHKIFTTEEIIAMFGPPEEVSVERVVGKARLAEVMADYYEYYSMHHPRMADAYAGIRDLLEYLKNHGIILAVFTGKGKRTTIITLEQLGIINYFDLLVTGDDVENYKPSADGIRKVLKKFKLQPEDALMVGDAVSDVRAAREAGVPIAAVLWDSYGKEHVLKMDVDYLFHDVAGFAAWLKAAIVPNGDRPD